MKTSPKSLGKANVGRAILTVVLAVALGSSGCQKEDELMLSNNSSKYGSYTEATDINIDNPYYNLGQYANFENESSVADNTAKLNVFTVIKFYHRAGNSQLPDYAVTVRSNGCVIYEGHNNVRVMSTVTFTIAISDMPALHEVFKQYDFYGIVPDFEVYPGMPVVFTTYQPYEFVKPMTIYDDYDNNPHDLVMIRKTVEKILGIDLYVNQDWAATLHDPAF